MLSSHGLVKLKFIVLKIFQFSKIEQIPDFLLYTL